MISHILIVIAALALIALLFFMTFGVAFSEGVGYCLKKIKEAYGEAVYNDMVYVLHKREKEIKHERD